MREKLLLCFLTLQNVSLASADVQFINFWRESDAFSASVFEDIYTTNGKRYAKQFARRYQRVKQLMSFYQDSGPCDSKLWSPNYELVEVKKYNRREAIAINIGNLAQMLADWMSSYACFTAADRGLGKRISVPKRSIKDIRRLTRISAFQRIQNTYLISSDKMNYDEALAFCYLQGMYLANPAGNSNLLTSLSDALDQNEQYWFEGMNSCSTINHDGFIRTENCELNYNAVCQTERTEISTTTTEIMPIEPSDVFILVIPDYGDESYLQSGDGSSQISATINASDNRYAYDAAHALVNGKLHIFGGSTDYKKIVRLDDCSLNDLTARLNEDREFGHAALSIENGKKALICFGWDGDNRKTCEIFDGSTTVSTFASDWTHQYGGLGLYKNQPTSVGCYSEKHQKAETLSATGWIALPDHPKRISSHSLVGLENQSMLLLGGTDHRNSGSSQSGIGQLKDENWNEIGDFLQPVHSGSVIYIGRSIYYFGDDSAAIQRIDFTETEEFQKVEQIGNEPDGVWPYFPVLFQTVSNFCI
ncbi:unnamed protein product [Oikopleura dioica]|uniref:C-type lectin domain-containing protein n=1 Tax=Oikopleura dioica TaxID=34765 RepID=E4XR74_OIKDI|nr:unnamed protein product [Oikopleura dioica]